MSKLQVDDIVNKEDNWFCGTSRGAVVDWCCHCYTFDGNLTGNVTGTASEASEATAAFWWCIRNINYGKTSPGKAIALSMVFG